MSVKELTYRQNIFSLKELYQFYAEYLQFNLKESIFEIGTNSEENLRFLSEELCINNLTGMTCNNSLLVDIQDQYPLISFFKNSDLTNIESDHCFDKILC